MKDILSGYELYQKKYGHLCAMAFPIDEESPWHSGLDSLEYVASKILAAGYGQPSADEVCLDKSALVKEAINLAEMMLDEIEYRRRERMEACDREVAEEKARREAIGAESQKFISGFRWAEWIQKELHGDNSPGETRTPWSKRLVHKTSASVKDDDWWLEKLVSSELKTLGFEKDDTNKKTNRFWGIEAKFDNNICCSFFYSNKKGGDNLRKEYNLHAISNLPDGLPGVQVWTYKQPTEHPVRQTQTFLGHFVNLGFILEMPSTHDDLPF